MNLEDIMLSEIIRLKKTHTVPLLLYDVPRVGGVIERSKMMVAKSCIWEKWRVVVQSFSFAR